MHQISEALKRARREQAIAAVEPSATHPPEHTQPPARESIVYSRTRAVAPQPEALRARRIVSAFLPGPYLDAYKILCAQVLHKMRENKHQVLAITSPGDGEGKTLTAINLACCVANEVDQTVLLVDADLRRPRMHEYFGIECEHGLASVLTGEARVEDVLVHPNIGKLVMLAGGRPTPDSSELLGSRRMQALLRELKARYASRIVIFDLPPVLTAADVLAFAPFVEALLLVVEDGVTSKDRLEQTALMLHGQNVLGTVLNKVRTADPPEGHAASDAPRAKGWRWRRAG